MITIERKAFTANADNEVNLLNLLIDIAGFKDRSSFASYMGVDTAILAENPLWAKNYLSDIINADLTHLGYVMKDTKQSGMLGEYREAVKSLTEVSVVGDTIQTPIVINESIVTEEGTLKISILTNATRSIKNVMPA